MIMSVLYQYRNVLINSITIGVVCLLLTHTTVEVKHYFTWDGIYISSYRLIFI